MKIAFVTTQSLIQSTVIGRILPVAQELEKMGNEMVVLVHEEDASSDMHSLSSITIKSVGKNPFRRTLGGKKRKKGLGLLLLVLSNAIRAAGVLINTHPDVIVIVKPLPENTFAVMLARMVLRKVTIVLDVDDFELFANVLSSLPERAVLHWAERRASKMAGHIIAATPFLADHMRAIAQKDTPVTLIPTGLTIQPLQTGNNEIFSHTITYIGSISESSGHLVYMLPEILERVRKVVPDAKMLLAGSGDDEQPLKQLFAEKNLEHSVEWFGRFSDSDIPEIISRTGILVDPIDDSIVNRAKSSFRAMLACVSGLPIVTSNIGIRPIIIPEILHARSFAKSHDAQEYTDRILSFFQNPLSSEEVALLKKEAMKYSHHQTAELYYTCLV